MMTMETPEENTERYMSVYWAALSRTQRHHALDKADAIGLEYTTAIMKPLLDDDEAVEDDSLRYLSISWFSIDAENRNKVYNEFAKMETPFTINTSAPIWAFEGEEDDEDEDDA